MSLLLLLWAKPVNFQSSVPETLIGQARIKLNELSSNYPNGPRDEGYSLVQARLCLGNKQVGSVNVKIKFSLAANE